MWQLILETTWSRKTVLYWWLTTNEESRIRELFLLMIWVSAVTTYVNFFQSSASGWIFFIVIGLFFIASVLYVIPISNVFYACGMYLHGYMMAWCLMLQTGLAFIFNFQSSYHNLSLYLWILFVPQHSTFVFNNLTMTFLFPFLARSGLWNVFFLRGGQVPYYVYVSIRSATPCLWAHQITYVCTFQYFQRYHWCSKTLGRTS